MANSKYGIPPEWSNIIIDTDSPRFEYVKQFEQADNLLPNTWIVIRIDGRGFTKYNLLFISRHNADY
jgi:Uncharacterized conserved protein